VNGIVLPHDELGAIVPLERIYIGLFGTIA